MRHTHSILTPIALALLLVPAGLAAPGGIPGAPAGSGNGPTHDTVDVQFNMTGTAIRTDGGPDDTFTFFINATGEATRKTPNGNGVQIRADQLFANVIVVDADGNEVENYTADLRFHAQQASHLAQGLDGFRFNMQLTGKRSDSVLSNENEGGRVLSMNAHGESTYVDSTDDGEDNGAFTVNGRGQTTTKDGQDNSANHYNFLLGGTATITEQ